MFYFYIFCTAFSVLEIHSANIEKKINDYFNSDTFNSFQKDWKKDKKSYENAIRLALKDNYGYKGMNVYIRRSPDSHRISNGFYLYDNVVGVMFHDMFLGELPHLIDPEVKFALASNALRLESGLDKMFVHTRYTLFRNHSDVFIGGTTDGKHSPFTYEVVENTGNVAIVAEDCKLAGYAIIKLNGQSVDIGHNTYRVSNCKFTVEISSVGLGREPIIAPYFNKQQRKAIQKMISKPIREELLPKIQATLLTYINTTIIFQNRLSEYRQQQRKLFKDTSRYILNIIKNFNKNTLQMSSCAILLKPLEITWNICVERPCDVSVALEDVSLCGLDTIYSGHTGGPYKWQSLKIIEALRFHYLQVRGKMYYTNETINREHEFFAELHDVTFDTEVDINKDVQDSSFVDWRSIELSIVNFKGNIEERMNANSFINSYLLNEIPKAITVYLHKKFGNSHKRDRYNTDGELSSINAIASSSRSQEREDNKEQNNSNSYQIEEILTEKEKNNKENKRRKMKLKFSKKEGISKDGKINVFDKTGEISKNGKVVVAERTAKVLENNHFVKKTASYDNSNVHDVLG